MKILLNISISQFAAKSVTAFPENRIIDHVYSVNLNRLFFSNENLLQTIVRVPFLKKALCPLGLF
jgi:hypothetical protein